MSATITTGITPAMLPTLGLLDQLAANNGLHGAVFTALVLKHASRARFMPPERCDHSTYRPGCSESNESGES
jgi:hypothetical protein